MNKKQSIVAIIICLCPLTANAVTFDEMLGHHPSKTQSFWGYQYKNIKWVSHTPDTLNDPEEQKALEEAVTGLDAEADDRGQTDIGMVDLDGDTKEETVKVIWGGGVSDHSLTIEVYKDGRLISTLDDREHGIQPNFKIEDVDGDGRKEIIIWSGLWDFRMPGEDDITEENYEGHSGPHRYVVATYKFIKGHEFRPDEYYLWDIYTTKKKYEPFCQEQPE